MIKITETANIEIKDEINALSFLNENELAILTCNGFVIKYNIQNNEETKLFETKAEKNIEYQDGGFDPGAKSSVYTMDGIIAVANDYKTHGFVFNKKENYLIRFTRENYYAEFSHYPLTLFKYKNEPHIIFAVAWNHIQIANLSTRQIITADKSIIGENAEKTHIESIKEYGDGNKLFWPNEYDYFFGKLIMSPNEKKFVSRGWIWGSYDLANIYDVKEFIQNHRIKDRALSMGEHSNRPLCFVDNSLVASLCNPYKDGDDEKEDRYEICLYNTDGIKKDKIIIKDNFDFSESDMYYSRSKKCFYIFSDKIGFIAVSHEGDTIFYDKNLFPKHYSTVYEHIICHEKNSINIYKIV